MKDDAPVHTSLYGCADRAKTDLRAVRLSWQSAEWQVVKHPKPMDANVALGLYAANKGASGPKSRRLWEAAAVLRPVGRSAG